ncbi:MAG TPA: TIGR03067 domain-containing protein, partial [Gemmata sp.]|nr:TIGR03067 domain-containing protein [Gemmata sp.]
MAVTFLRTGRTIENKFTLDPTKSPKAFDILPSDKSSQGIYEFEGDALKICLGNHDVRPTKFGGKMGMVTAIYRLTRQ